MREVVEGIYLCILLCAYMSRYFHTLPQYMFAFYGADAIIQNKMYAGEYRVGSWRNWRLRVSLKDPMAMF